MINNNIVSNNNSSNKKRPLTSRCLTVSDFLGSQDPLYQSHLEGLKRVKLEPGLYETEINEGQDYSMEEPPLICKSEEKHLSSSEEEELRVETTVEEQ